MRSAPDLLLLSTFFFFFSLWWHGRARPRCRFGDPLTWQGQQGQWLHFHRSGLSLCWAINFSAVDDTTQNTASEVDRSAWSDSVGRMIGALTRVTWAHLHKRRLIITVHVQCPCPTYAWLQLCRKCRTTEARKTILASKSAGICISRVFEQFLAPPLKKIQILWRGWAVRRMIAKSASTRPSPFWGAPRTSALWWNRALPPPFFYWRYTTPPCVSHEWSSPQAGRESFYHVHVLRNATARYNCSVQQIDQWKELVRSRRGISRSASAKDVGRPNKARVPAPTCLPLLRACVDDVSSMIVHQARAPHRLPSPAVFSKTRCLLPEGTRRESFFVWSTTPTRLYHRRKEMFRRMKTSCSSNISFCWWFILNHELLLRLSRLRLSLRL